MNTYLQEKNIAQTIYTLREGAFAGLAITSSITIYNAASNALGKWIHSTEAIIIASAFFAFLFYLIIDGPLSKLMPYFFNKWHSKNWKTRQDKGLIREIGFVAFVFLAISASLTFWSRYIITDNIIAPPDNSALLKQVDEQTETFNATRQDLKEELRNARATEAQRIRNAKKEGERLIRAAIASGPVAWQEHYKSGNGWFAKQRGRIGKYLAGIEQAKDKAEDMVEAERNVVKDLETKFTGYTTDTRKDSLLFGLTALHMKDVERMETRKSIWNNTLFILDLIFLLGALLGSRLLAKARAHYGVDVEYESEHSFISVVRESSHRIWQWALGKVNQWVQKLPTVAAVGATLQNPGATIPPDHASGQLPTGLGGAPQGATGGRLSLEDALLLSQQLDRANSKLRSYQSKLRRHEGRKETNERGIRKWEAIVSDLEKRLQDQ